MEILILAALIGVGSLAGAAGYWIEGVEPTGDRPALLAPMVFSLLIAFALLLVGAGAAGSGRPTGLESRGRRHEHRRLQIHPPAMAAVVLPGSASGDRPGGAGMALATAHVPLRYDAQSRKTRGVPVSSPTSSGPISPTRARCCSAIG